MRRQCGYWLAVLVLCGQATWGQRQMEHLDRGGVAVSMAGGGVFVSWRLLGTDNEKTAFHLYRDGTRLTAGGPLREATCLLDPAGTAESIYTVRPVVAGQEQPPGAAFGVWPHPYLDVPLQPPAGGTLPDGVVYEYTPNDASVGDLDGDGEYELVLKWTGRERQSGEAGYTSAPILEALEFSGTSLWRIQLGPNIRDGSHYTQFMVYDLDGDGRAEVACKTADGTTDGTGKVIADAAVDYRDKGGQVLDGDEFLTVFDGRTGKALATVPYIPPRGEIEEWGDDYGNRVDRFLACVAYLDGKRPSLIMARGYYSGRNGRRGRTVVAAWNWRDGQLVPLWNFDTRAPELREYVGQGFHNLAVGDVDGDGKDEIMYGACAIDDDGTGLYTTGFGHGDAGHLGDLDPNHPGLEYLTVHESANGTTIPGMCFRAAGTGKVLWSKSPKGDVGRGVAADLLAEFPGAECWGGKGLGLFDCHGNLVGPQPRSMNFLIWWDGDPLRELLDANWIGKYEDGQIRRLFEDPDCVANNSTKATPCLSGDLFGDWREEVIWRTKDSRHLRVYTTTIPTDRRLVTLMHDPVYRLAIAWQNTAYNQPPHPGFFLGHGMTDPPWPQITVPGQ